MSLLEETVISDWGLRIGHYAKLPNRLINPSCYLQRKESQKPSFLLKSHVSAGKRHHGMMESAQNRRKTRFLAHRWQLGLYINSFPREGYLLDWWLPPTPFEGFSPIPIEGWALFLARLFLFKMEITFFIHYPACYLEQLVGTQIYADCRRFKNNATICVYLRNLRTLIRYVE